MTVQESRRAKWGYIFLLPWIILFCVFYAYPFVYGIIVSLTNFKIGSMSWVGLDNYKKIFNDYAFWRSLIATACYTVIVIPLEVFIPMWAANTLRAHGDKFNTLTKLIFYVPGIVCSVVLVIVWKLILAPNTGLISILLARLGLTNFSLFDSAVTSIPVLSLMIVLSCLGANLIIYVAAINGIPETYYEAAELDGASRSQQFRSITMPMLRPSIIYVFVTSTISSLQIFVIPYLMTGGGPNYTSSTLLMMIYNSAFLEGNFGYASAVGVVLFGITAVIAVLQFKAMNSETVEY